MNLREALTRQIGIEFRLAELYKRFFLRFSSLPAYNTFWLQMSNEEAGHENLLGNLLELVDHDPQSHTLSVPELETERFDRIDIELTVCMSEADSPNFTIQRAFDMAIRLESGEIEILFESILKFLDPRVDRALTTFMIENLDHKQRLISIRRNLPDKSGVALTE